MGKKLNFDGILSYDDLGNSPVIIASELGEELSKQTKGYVEGKVMTYEGPIESYNEISSFATIVAALGSSVIKKDIQEELGQQGYEEYKYEFSLFSPYLDTYKYRIMFFKFGVGVYPVKIVLEQGIADEIFKKDNSDYIFEANTSEEFENMVLNILQSKKVIGVMQELIYAGRRQEQLKKEDK